MTLESSVSFNKNRGIDLFDTKSKSTYSVPAIYCTDLKGCGLDTHNKGQLAFTANYREECESPLLGLQASYSGFSSRQQTPSNLSAMTLNIGGVAVTASIAALAIFLGELVSPTSPATALKAILGVPANDPTLVEKLVGSQYVLTRKTSNRVVATLSRPLFEERIDICDRSIGFSRSSSLSLYGFDTVTCQSTTLWQASLSTFLATEVYGNPSSNLGTVLLGDITDFKVIEILAAVTSAIGCAGVQEVAESVWRTLLAVPPATNDIVYGVA